MKNAPVKDREYLKIYEFGFGMVSVQGGIITFGNNDENTKERFPFIDLSILKDYENGKVGKELNLDPEAYDYVKLLFTSIESLEVLERAIAFCRKELESKQTI